MATAHEVAQELLSRRPRPVSGVTRPDVPDQPGLYAWWHRGPLSPPASHAATGPTVSLADEELELIYVGIGGNLRSRIVGKHLGLHTGSSTLRRALGAWLGAEQGWERAWRAERVQHDAASEKAITAWMKAHLFVTWVVHPNPGAVEGGVIAELQPPLNHAENQSHPNWPALEKARSAWRSWRPEA